jgi:hypothetical protein
MRLFFTSLIVFVSSVISLCQSTTIVPGGGIFNNTDSLAAVQLPKLSYDRIKKIPNPQQGMVVFDSDSKCLRYFDGSKWIRLSDSKSDPFIANGVFSSTELLAGSTSFSSFVNYENSQILQNGESVFFSGITSNTGNGGDPSNNKTLTGLGCINASPAYFPLRTGFIVKYGSRYETLWCMAFSKSNSSGIDSESNVTGISLIGSSLYATGYFNNSLDINGVEVSANGYDSFIAKFNAINGQLIWLKKITNGSGNEKTVAIETDAQENIYVAGNYNSSVTIGNSVTYSHSGNGDFFISKFNSDGNYISSTNVSTIYKDEVNEMIKNDNSTKLLLCGTFQNTVQVGTSSLSGETGNNMFVLSLNLNLLQPSIFGFNTTGKFKIQDIKNLSINDIIIGGNIEGTASADNQSFENDGFVFHLDLSNNSVRKAYKIAKANVKSLFPNGYNSFYCSIDHFGYFSIDQILVPSKLLGSITIIKINNSKIEWFKTLNNDNFSENSLPTPYYNSGNFAYFSGNLIISLTSQFGYNASQNGKLLLATYKE